MIDITNSTEEIFDWQVFSKNINFVLVMLGGGVYVVGNSVSGAGQETITPVYQQNTTFHS